jgi:hypothetical protein
VWGRSRRSSLLNNGDAEQQVRGAVSEALGG